MKRMKNHFLILFDTEDKSKYEQYKGELFIVDDRYTDDIARIYHLKENYDGEYCPRCGSVSNYYHLEYNDNNGVIGKKIVCPYCSNMKDNDFDTDEKILKHFDNIKKMILLNRLKLNELKKYYNIDFVAEKVIKLKSIDFKNKKSNNNFITFNDYKIQGMDLNILISENYDKYIICIPTDNDAYIKNIEVQTEQDVIEYLNEELDNKEEMCFKISEDKYLEIHRCDDGWDYTIYDKDYKDIDGGVLCNPEYNLLRALETFKEDFIPKEYRFDTIKPIDYLEEL